MVEDTTINDELDEWINNSIRQVETFLDFPHLHGRTDVTSDSSGVITVPSYIRTVTQIAAGSSVPYDYTFYFRDEYPTGAESRFKEYFYVPYGISTTAPTSYSVDATVSSQTISKNSGSWMTSSDVGLGGFFTAEGGTGQSATLQPGPYEITAVDTGADEATIYPDYRGATDTALTFLVHNPLRYQLYDKDDAVYASKTIHLEFQRFHPPVYSDTDIIMFDCHRVLRVIMEMEMLRNGKYDADATRLEDDLALAKIEELSPAGHRQTRNLPQGFGGRGPMFSRYGTYRTDARRKVY